MIRRLPNLLSCLRIALSVALAFLVRRPLAFAIVYALSGISDVLDGWIARKYHAQSPLGAKLDSIGDLVYFGVALWVLYPFLAQQTWVLGGVIAVAAVRAVNALITRLKFGQWGIMHTLGNKLSGLLLFLALPVCVWVDGVPTWLAIPVLSITMLSALEEGAILLTSRRYDVDRKSIFP